MSWEHAYGAFLGVLCGDAAGATLEFFRGEIRSADVDNAMTMPGGGIWRVGKGQITDDSELALSLAQALAAHSPQGGFPLDAVAAKYSEWCLSGPFDMGNTCCTAFKVKVDSADASLGQRMVEVSAQYNATSEANGSLMRIMPLAIWSSKLPDDKLVEYARLEPTLSHPNQVCQDVNAIYCLLVAHLINHPGDSQGALRKAEAFVKESVHSTVRDWFLTESLDVSALKCTKARGHVRWAFNLALYHLRQNSTYEKAIRETLLKGGDTDTNAAIVGGLMGALHGVSAIPETMRKAVLAFDCAGFNPGRKRPATYQAAQVESLTRALLDQADSAT